PLQACTLTLPTVISVIVVLQAGQFIVRLLVSRRGEGAPPPKLWTTLRWSKGKPAAGWHPKRRIERQNRPEAREPGAALRCQQARQESNLQPPVLETGALPIELRT